MVSNKFRLTIQDLQRTLTRKEAFAIARLAIKRGLAQASKRHALRSHEAYDIANRILRQALNESEVESSSYADVPYAYAVTLALESLAAKSGTGLRV